MISFCIQSMFPPSSTAYLQTGFRTPEIYTLAIVSVLSIGSTASDIHIIIFYYATALVVAIGAISWVIVARSKPAMAYFAQKDQNYERKFSLQDGERASLLSNKSSASHPNYANAENREISSDGDLLSHISQRLLSSSLLQPRSEYSVYGDKFADMQLDEEGNEDGAVNKRTDDDIAYEDIDYVAAIILPCKLRTIQLFCFVHFLQLPVMPHGLIRKFSFMSKFWILSIRPRSNLPQHLVFDFFRRFFCLRAFFSQCKYFFAFNE